MTLCLHTVCGCFYGTMTACKPTKPKILILWLIIEKVCQPLQGAWHQGLAQVSGSGQSTESPSKWPPRLQPRSSAGVAGLLGWKPGAAVLILPLRVTSALTMQPSKERQLRQQGELGLTATRLHPNPARPGATTALRTVCYMSQ